MIRKNVDPATEQEQEQKSQQTQSGQVPGDGRAPDPSDFVQIMSSYGASANISVHGTEFVKAVRQQLEDPSRGIKIETRQLPEPSGSMLFAYGQQGIILNFEEAISIDPAMPKSAVNSLAVRSAKAIMGNEFKVLNSIIISPEDYGRPKHTADHLADTLRATASSQVSNMTIEAMAKSQFSVDIDASNTRSFLDSISPHAVRSRGDIGFTINMRRDDLPSLNPNPNYQQATFSPIIGVTAYVEFLQTMDNDGITPKYLPVIHITEIASKLPTFYMAATAIAVAADLFIGKQLWKNQFSSFDKNKPNIGNLIIDPETNQPWTAGSAELRDQFINHYCKRPVLAIDVTDGRARIPKLEKLADPSTEAQASVRKIFGDFLGISIPANITPGNCVFQEFVGIVSRGGELYDSRIVDYLTCVQGMGNNPRIGDLLRRDSNPIPRAELIKELMSDFRRLYVNQVCVLEAELVRTMGEIVHKVLRITNSFNAVSGINMDLLLTQSDQYASGSFTVTSAMGPGYNSAYNYNITNPGSLYGH